MEAECPKCRSMVVVEDAAHYREVTCASCGNVFEAISQETRQVGQAYLDQILSGGGASPSEAGAPESPKSEAERGGDGRNRTAE